MNAQRLRILVAGGAGFVGSHLCSALVEQGHRTTVVDNLTLGKEENLAALASRAEDFRFIEGDVRDESLMEPLLEGQRFDAIYHLAANSDIGKGSADPDIDRGLTFDTTYGLLQMARRHSVGRFVFTSSSAIFGEHEGVLTEDSGPALPASAYGAAKLASEAFLSAFSQSYGIKTWIIRFPNVIGERCTHGVIFDFVRKLKNSPHRLEILGNGLQRKPYIYVRDLIGAILHITSTAIDDLNVYNVGVRGCTTVRDIAGIVAAGMGLSPEMVYTGGDRGWIGDVPHYEYNCAKLLALGWEPPRTSDESVTLAVTRILECMHG